jgi:uncharacterized protein YecE (DUF72 family)
MPEGFEIRVGCAGWTIPRPNTRFPGEGSHLERYASGFNAVEINSSFYRHHRHATYSRWAAAVPGDFRFAIKLPRQVTHEARLSAAEDVLARFLDEIAGLGRKLGPVLVQLPPSLKYQPDVACAFFEDLRSRFAGVVVCEPRHTTWFSPDAGQRLADFTIARVAADPAVVPIAAEPGGWPGVAYYRLHGSPRMYYSAYSGEYLDALARRLAEAAGDAPAWCIFDNTAEFAAVENALRVVDRIGRLGPHD